MHLATTSIPPAAVATPAATPAAPPAAPASAAPADGLYCWYIIRVAN